jgi:hypothetical protein
MTSEKKKRGRKPKADPQRNRVSIRMNGKDYERFLAMYKRSGMPSYSAFIADCVLNKPLKIIEINKTAIDFVMLLTGLYAQFRAIASNYNQVVRHLKRNFPEEKALAMLYRLEQATIDVAVFKKEIEAKTEELRRLCLPK